MFSLETETLKEIESLLEKLKNQNHQKRLFGESLRENKDYFSNLPPHLSTMTPDKQLIIDLEPEKLNGLTVGGVDGGYSSRTLIGVDLFVFRAIAVFFTFSDKTIQKTTYFPSRNPPIDIALTTSGLSSHDAETLGSLKRAMAELQVAYQVLKQSSKKIDILLMDGSPTIKSPKTEYSRITNYVTSYKSILTRLVKLADSTNVKLMWVVKDSRLNMFAKILGKIVPFMTEKNPRNFFKEKIDYRGLIRSSRDMDLFYHILETNSRSFAYKREKEEVLEYLNDEYDLLTFFLKTVPYDVPLRIELFKRAETSNDDAIALIDKVSSVVLSLSNYNPHYSVPAPIVEADARVKIKQNEVDVLVKYLRGKILTPEIWYPRRSRSLWRF